MSSIFSQFDRSRDLRFQQPLLLCPKVPDSQPHESCVRAGHRERFRAVKVEPQKSLREWQPESPTNAQPERSRDSKQ